MFSTCSQQLEVPPVKMGRKKTCTQFFVKTSFDLIMLASRSNENLIYIFTCDGFGEVNVIKIVNENFVQ